MVQKGCEYTCDRCGKKMFVENMSPEKHQWKKFSCETEEIFGTVLTNEKDLCYKCYRELMDILTDFFDGEEVDYASDTYS